MRKLGHIERESPRVWPASLAKTGTEALEALTLDGEANSTSDHQMADVARLCLKGDTGDDAARLINAIVQFSAQRYGINDISETASAVAASAPIQFLNAAIGDPEAGGLGLELRVRYRKSPLSSIPTDVLLSWCAEKEERWGGIVDYIDIFPSDYRGTTVNADDEGLSQQIRSLLENAPNPGVVVDKIFDDLAPRGFSGSRAVALERRLKLVEELQEHPRVEVATAVAEHLPRIHEWVSAERQREAIEDVERD